MPSSAGRPRIGSGGAETGKLGSRIDGGIQSSGGIARLLPVIALALAVAVALSGAVLVVLMAVTRSPVADVVSPAWEAQAGGLSVRIDSAEWLSDEMPADLSEEMSPGEMSAMPAPGEERLHLTLTLLNDGDGLRDFGPDDFSLRSSSGEAWPLLGSNLVEGSLRPGQALSGALSFDVPATESGLSLVLTKGDSEVKIPLGDGPGKDDESQAE